MKNQLKKLALRLRGDERGLTTVEYLILLCLISALAVGAWQTLGHNVVTNLGQASKTIDGPVGPASQGTDSQH